MFWLVKSVDDSRLYFVSLMPDGVYGSKKRKDAFKFTRKSTALKIARAFDGFVVRLVKK